MIFKLSLTKITILNYLTNVYSRNEKNGYKSH